MSEKQSLVPMDEALETDDDRMAYTQGLRKKLISVITDNGTKMPEEKGDRVVLLMALGDMDRTALANKKIGSTERIGAADRQAAMVISRLSRQEFNTPSGSPFERPVDDNVIDAEFTDARVLLDSAALPQLELAPGETDVGLATRNYQEFMTDNGEEV